MSSFLSSVWDVFLLFRIPLGGGIPAGVVMAHGRGLAWPFIMALYFASDLVLILVYEPILILIAKKSRGSEFLVRFRAEFLKSMIRIGLEPSSFALVWIAFGSDPIMGRLVSKAFGHGFVTGWALVLLGDMLFFAMILASTLWLNSILGDGTLTAIVITVAMLLIPPVVRRIRAFWLQRSKGFEK